MIKVTAMMSQRALEATATTQRVVAAAAAHIRGEKHLVAAVMTTTPVMTILTLKPVTAAITSPTASIIERHMTAIAMGRRSQETRGNHGSNGSKVSRDTH